jgi:prepilin-type N-terminal cleavage/methylation domain-containing protein
MSGVPSGPNAGYSLVELIIVIMIVGIIARIAIPQYYKSAEKNKTHEAVQILYSLQAAQDRFKANYGRYCNAAATDPSCAGFDLIPPPMKYFQDAPPFAAGAGGNQSWTLTLTRAVSVATYGQYQVTYDIEPGAPPVMTCSGQGSCTADLLPQPQ